jgi:hypothetical protein
MILAGLTCVAHGRPLPGNLSLGTDCLLMAGTRQSAIDPSATLRSPDSGRSRAMERTLTTPPFNLGPNQAA